MIRRVIAYCMLAWIDERAERRKVRDAKIREDMFDLLRNEFGVEVAWERVPQRLRYGIKRDIPARLEETAKDSREDLPYRIANARALGVDIAAQEERRLYELALKGAYGVRRKTHFAKLIHGNPLPTEVILQLARDMGEVRGFFTCGDNHDIVEPFLDILGRENEPVIREYLELLADCGRYLHLKTACNILKREIPPELLQTCFETKLQQENYYCQDAVEMCIKLQDWERGEDFIRKWCSDPERKKYASAIALAMQLERMEETTS